MIDDHTTWAIERERATELFDATPYDADDAEIANVFNQHPAAVIAEITRIADAYQNGKIHSPWRALKSRLPRITNDARPIHLTQDLRVRQAENWIRNAGHYCPSEAEILDELFSSRGLLAGQQDAFADRMLSLWRNEQARTELAAIDLETRAAQWKQGQESLRQGKSTPLNPDLDAIFGAPRDA